MKNQGTSADTRETILRAAERVVLRDGVLQLTLEAAAREAGVSKGGLLYHFKTKEDLILGLVEGLLDEWEKGLETELAADTGGPGSWTRAYIKCNLNPGAVSSEALALCAALLAAVTIYPNLKVSAGERIKAWFDDHVEKDGIPPETAMIAALAADGIAFYDMLGLWKPTPDQMERLHTALLNLTRPPASGE